MKPCYIALLVSAGFGFVSALPAPVFDTRDVGLESRDLSSYDADEGLFLRDEIMFNLYDRALSDWVRPHTTSEFDAHYGATTSEKNHWGATHYAHIKPTSAVGPDGHRVVTVTAVPHGTPPQHGAYGIPFGSSHAPGYHGRAPGHR